MSIFRFLMLLCLSLPAFGQDWPTKPVKFIVPFPPGGSVDAVARLAQAHVARVRGGIGPTERLPVRVRRVVLPGGGATVGGRLRGGACRDERGDDDDGGGGRAQHGTWFA